MAISDSDFSGSFQIPAPTGVFQAEGDTNISPNYAYVAENIRTERGLLATAYGTSRAFPSLEYPIETLERFYRRTRPDDPDIYVAAAHGTIFTYTTGAPGWVERATGFYSSVWSAVTYETVKNGDTVDVLIMSNAKDGMIVVYGDDLSVEQKELNIGTDYQNIKFAHLGRYAERIWGLGADGYPDSVFYSKPYDPFNWDADTAYPEMGGGVINQPTWDGDSFMAIEPFGDYLLCMKERTTFELHGTDPRNFSLAAAYGTDGPVYARTVVTDRQIMLYLSQAGLGIYNGSTLSLLSKDALYETMRMRMPGTEQMATACVSGHVYYLALAIRERADDIILENNTVIEYDILRGTFMIRKGIRVKDFYAIGGKIYFTEAASPYEVLLYDDKAATSYNGSAIASTWETPWLDLGKQLSKKDFVLRFTAEADTVDLPLEITIITPLKSKTKILLLKNYRKDYRLKIQNSGIRVKLRIHSEGRLAGWRIFGGVQVEYTFDGLQR